MGGVTATKVVSSTSTSNRYKWQLDLDAIMMGGHSRTEDSSGTPLLIPDNSELETGLGASPQEGWRAFLCVVLIANVLIGCVSGRRAQVWYSNWVQLYMSSPHHGLIWEVRPSSSTSNVPFAHLLISPSLLSTPWLVIWPSLLPSHFTHTTHLLSDASD